MKTEQIKQQLKICSDYVNKLDDASANSSSIKIDDRPFIELKRLISSTDTWEATELENTINRLNSTVSRFTVGRLYGIVNMLASKYKNIEKSYKIFISHAHKDEVIIEKFTEKILRLGCAIDSQDIFCTSIEAMGIKTGEDIRNHIKTNMMLSDYVFLMISENYINSTMCLNEIGASWALDKKVKPFLFPPLRHDAIWLLEILKSSPINDSATLDKLHEELVREYPLKTGGISDWNKQKADFIASMN